MSTGGKPNTPTWCEAYGGIWTDDPACDETSFVGNTCDPCPDVAGEPGPPGSDDNGGNTSVGDGVERTEDCGGGSGSECYTCDGVYDWFALGNGETGVATAVVCNPIECANIAFGDGTLQDTNVDLAIGGACGILAQIDLSTGTKPDCYQSLKLDLEFYCPGCSENSDPVRWLMKWSEPDCGEGTSGSAYSSSELCTETSLEICWDCQDITISTECCCGCDPPTPCGDFGTGIDICLTNTP